MIAAITGATGFIGSHLADRLLGEGHDVRALVRKTSNLRWLDGKPVSLIEGDVRDPGSLEPLLRGADIVYHVAGLVKARTRDEYFEANTRATRTMLEATARFAPDVTRFLFVSSQTAAGPSPALDAPVNEDSPCHPITRYGESKLAAEQEVKGYTGRIPWTIVRPPAVFGPRDTEILLYFQAIARGLNSMIGFDDKRLNLVYSDDLVTGIVTASRHPAAVGQTYFIAGEEFHSWPQVGRIASRAIGRKTVTIRIPHAIVFGIAALSQAAAAVRGRAATLNIEKARDITRRYWTCDVSKARREIGFRAGVSIEEAIERTVAWYRGQGWM